MIVLWEREWKEGVECYIAKTPRSGYVGVVERNTLDIPDPEKSWLWTAAIERMGSQLGTAPSIEEAQRMVFAWWQGNTPAQVGIPRWQQLPPPTTSDDTVIE
jgi:hypothetical protein